MVDTFKPIKSLDNIKVFFIYSVFAQKRFILQWPISLSQLANTILERHK